MPLYEYECDACGRRFEIIQKFSDPPPEACKACGKGPVRRLLSSPAIQFKGAGWYVNDYGGKKATSGDGEKADKPVTEATEAGNKDKESASKEAASKDAKESKEKKSAKKK